MDRQFYSCIGISNSVKLNFSHFSAGTIAVNTLPLVAGTRVQTRKQDGKKHE